MRLHGRVLIVAGSDSSGGAGIQADIKAVTALGGYAMTAVTALTAQNTLGVHGVHPVPPDFVAAQIAACLSDVGADAVKLGMLGDAATVEAVADALAGLAPGLPIVLDPVMVAKGGHPLLTPDAAAALRARLLPMAALVTPNLPEAEALLGRALPDRAARAEAALELARTARAALVKGGHAEAEDPVVDLLAVDGAVIPLASPRQATRSTHGTGCTLASAIACGLAQGRSLRDAVARASAYVAQAIAEAPGFGRGHGPLNHCAGLTRPD